MNGSLWAPVGAGRRCGIVALATAAVLGSVLSALAASGTVQSRPARKSPATTRAASTPRDFGRWEKAIAAFEASDRSNPPPKGAALFIGSSTVRLWSTLAADFPDHDVINRGFGGTHIVDATHFADRILIPYAPRVVFLRSGGNDLHAGKSPEQVFRDFKDFVAAIHAKLPTTEIVFIGLCPVPARWDEADATRELNERVEQYARRTARIRYIDCWSMSLDADGEARMELFRKDRLHFNDEGYRLLVEKVRPYMPTPQRRARPTSRQAN